MSDSIKNTIKKMVRGAVKEVLEDIVEETTTTLAKREPNQITKDQPKTEEEEQMSIILRALAERIIEGHIVPANPEPVRLSWECTACGCRRSHAMLAGMNPHHLDHNGEFDEDRFLQSIACPECGALSSMSKEEIAEAKKKFKK